MEIASTNRRRKTLGVHHSPIMVNKRCNRQVWVCHFITVVVVVICCYFGGVQQQPCGNSISLYDITTTTNYFGPIFVHAEDEEEEYYQEGEDETEYEEQEQEQQDCAMDTTTGECAVVQVENSTQTTKDTTTSSSTSSIQQRQQRAFSDDPNLHPMTYDVGNGPETTLVYIEPSIHEMYQSSSSSATTSTSTNHQYQRVTPSFNGFAGKFINMSNKKCTLYWEEYEGGPKHEMRHHNPFTASGTATFPTHRFVFTETGKPNVILHTMIVTQYPNNLYFFDPYYVENDPIATEQNLQGNLTKEERVMYDKWHKTRLYNEYYYNKTGRTYLANYLREPPMHHMWRADYFGQVHSIVTNETHFITEPPKKLLQPISDTGKKRRLNVDAPRILSEYRSQEPLNLTLKVISVVPRAFQIDNFLSDVEVDHIVELASGIKLSLSATGEYDPGERGIEKEKTVSNVKKTRTSYNSWVKRERSPIIDAIYRRSADLLKIDEALLRYRDKDEIPEFTDNQRTLAEDLQLVNYKVSQEYTSHHDFGYSRIGREKQGARFATLLLYLNEGMIGGETSFTRYVNAESFRELKVTPKVGKAVLFYSQLPDGNLDDFSQHAALPVIDGEKLINLWVWDPTYE